MQHEAQQAPIHRQRRQMAAQALGWRFDARDDLYVVQLDDGDIWRKKKPLGYVPLDTNERPGSQPIPPGEVPDELVTRTVDFRGKIIGNDQRDLRSRANGFSMGGAAWEPKGPIVDDSAAEVDLPVKVTCSGTKISARQVLTSGHCIFLDGSFNDNTKWIPGADGVEAILDPNSVSAPNGIKNREERIVRGPWFDHEWANYDFGVFILFDNSSSCSLHWHGWRKRSGLNNDPAFLFGYPNPNFECDDDSPLAGDACGGSIWGHGSNIDGYVDSYRFDHHMDTQEGQSGAGVYEITGDRFVLGVHRGPRGSINDAVRINDGNRDLINESRGDFPADACD
jgi:V8-like Glu-specific endopeptidase